MRARLPLALALAAALVLPAAASASSITYEGDSLVFHAAPGETNFVVVDGDDQQVTFTDDYTIQFPSGLCSQSDPEYPVACATPARAVRIDLGDGADRGSFGFSIPTDRTFEIDGGPGDDTLLGSFGQRQGPRHRAAARHPGGAQATEARQARHADDHGEQGSRARDAHPPLRGDVGP
jgi:hypothetical protein